MHMWLVGAAKKWSAKTRPARPLAMACAVELSSRIVAKAFCVGELESELRRIARVDYHFHLDSGKSVWKWESLFAWKLVWQVTNFVDIGVVCCYNYLTATQDRCFNCGN